MVLAVVIGVFVLLVAILIQQWVFIVAEEDHHFFGAVGGFFILFIISSLAIAWLTPDLTAHADIGAMANAWIQGPDANLTQELPLYGE
jgi:biotin transporter BioY